MIEARGRAKGVYHTEGIISLGASIINAYDQFFGIYLNAFIYKRLICVTQGWVKGTLNYSNSQGTWQKHGKICYSQFKAVKIALNLA